MSRSHRLPWCFAVLALVAIGCAKVGPAAPIDGSVPDGADGSTPPPTPDSGPVPPKNEAPPGVAITAPSDGAEVGGTVVVQGTANDDSGLASVFVQVGPNTPRLATTTNGFRTWTYTSAAPFGTFPIEAYGFDADGRRTPVPARILVNRPGGGGNGASPTVTILAPADGSTPRGTSVLVTGTASDDVAIVRMELLRNGEVIDERRIETENFYATWARTVPLLPGEQNVLVFRAYDELGNVGQATLTLFGRAEVDRDPPMLTVTTPTQSEVVNTATLAVTGSASDRLGVREVKVRVGTAFAGTGEIVYGDWIFATTTDGFASFAADLPIPSGAMSIEIKAIDVSGLATSVVRTIQNDYVAEWSTERRLPLFLRQTPNTTVRLELDEAGVNQVINPSIQQSLTILQLDPTSLLTSSLTQIKTACGTAWQQDNTNPNHNCALTPLGQTFMGPNGTWQTSAEYSLVRLLTMTPANVVVDGTSIANLKNLADALGIGGGFREILSDVLGISRTTEIVSTASVRAALQTGLLATHPNTGPNGELPITLYDAMNDLAPLGATLGPVGAHPGIVDPASPPYSQVFTDDFLMTIVAQSNLRWLDGIDLSDGKDYIAVVVDTTGPSFNDVLEFDFNDPQKFAIDGLVAAPTADLRIKVNENAAFIPACTGNTNTCKNNLPNSPQGTTYVWSRPSWQLEPIVARAAYNQYLNRTFNRTYSLLLIPAATITVGNPNGWATFTTLLNLGTPPPPQYLWELILEVGQVALHRLPNNVTIPEGQANVAFTLSDVPVGLTADQIRAAVRPTLQSQASTLSDMLLGDYSANNGPVDFYYRRGADGVPTLFFVSAQDPRPTPGYTYAKPGFYSDAALTTKVSTLNIAGSGDTLREKIRLLQGETVLYAQDETGAVYRLRFVVGADPTEITVYVSRKTS